MILLYTFKRLVKKISPKTKLNLKINGVASSCHTGHHFMLLHVLEIATDDRKYSLLPGNSQVVLVTWHVLFEHSQCQQTIWIPPSMARSRIPVQISLQPEFVEIAPVEKNNWKCLEKENNKYWKLNDRETSSGSYSQAPLCFYFVKNEVVSEHWDLSVPVLKS